jgi:anti-sigma factor RsiW
VVCEQYRDGLMALLDGEIAGNDRTEVERHLCECPACQTEFHRYERLLHLSHQLIPDLPCEQEFQPYWDGVCRKMHVHRPWLSWQTGAAIMLLAGLLMMFGFPGTMLLPRLLGAIAIVAAGTVLWMGHYCNSK